MKERKNKIIIGETKENKNYEEVVKMNKERELIKEVKENKEVEVKKNENKGVKNMEVKEVKKNENKGVKNMEVKQLVKEIEAKKMLLVEEVFKWAQGLCPIKSLHVKIKGRYYPLLEKETGKLSVIDKVQGKKLSFETLDRNMKFVIASILAERKEQIEKEVEEDKRKYLEKKISEIDELLNKF